MIKKHQIKCLVDYQFFLAELKAGYNSEILGMKLDTFCILCTDQKNLQNNSIKLLIDII